MQGNILGPPSNSSSSDSDPDCETLLTSDTGEYYSGEDWEAEADERQNCILKAVIPRYLAGLDKKVFLLKDNLWKFKITFFKK